MIEGSRLGSCQHRLLWSCCGAAVELLISDQLALKIEGKPSTRADLHELGMQEKLSKVSGTCQKAPLKPTAKPKIAKLPKIPLLLGAVGKRLSPTASVVCYSLPIWS